MPKPVEVWLVNNGAYWKAAWSDAGAKRGQRSQSIGSKAKYSRRQAIALCRQLGADLSMNRMRSRSAPRLSDWIQRYEKSRTDVQVTTRSTYRQCAAYLMAHFDHDPAIDRITRADAGDWHDAMTSGTLTGILKSKAQAEAGLDKPRIRWRQPSLSTIRRHVRTAKQMFEKAAKEDRILFNPFDRLKGVPPKPTKTWREVTPANMERILEACPNNAWRLLFALTRYAALRLNEALTLAWGDADWSGNRINVNERIRAESTKQRFRVCPIEPSRCPTGLMKMMREAFESADPTSKGPCDGIFRNNVRRTAIGIIERSKVGSYAKPFHTLRKNRVSELAMQYPQGVVMEWCGHDEDVSRRHYQRVPDELYVLPANFGREFGRKATPDARTERAPSAP